jgi:hypothetical protein
MISVFRADRYTGVVRQWIAAGASCVLVLQLLLGAVALGHSTLGLAGANSDAFVICHVVRFANQSRPMSKSPVFLGLVEI